MKNCTGQKIKKLTLFLTTTICATALHQTATAASARDFISIVWSSTVYPFATVVAGCFDKSLDSTTRKVESTGSGGGIQLFCSGVGAQSQDIANASRRIKESEFETCKKNGVIEIVAVKIGYEGITVARSKQAESMDFML